jgi:arylsulfatase A-like enzyme
VDDGVGRILHALKEHKLDDNTLVLFTADQGWGGGQHGIWGMGDHTRPLHAFDETVHVPLIVRQPGRIAAGTTSDILVSNYDLMPTLLDQLGFKDNMPRQPVSPGRSFAPVLSAREHGDKLAWDNVVFYEFENTRAIRTDAWKLIVRKDLDGVEAGPDELYDLGADPGQRKNVIGQAVHAEVEKDLRGRLDAFFERYAEPRYDLWRDGKSQARRLTRPKAKN